MRKDKRMKRTALFLWPLKHFLFLNNSAIETEGLTQYWRWPLKALFRMLYLESEVPRTWTHIRQRWTWAEQACSQSPSLCLAASHKNLMSAREMLPRTKVETCVCGCVCECVYLVCIRKNESEIPNSFIDSNLGPNFNNTAVQMWDTNENIRSSWIEKG